jgi:hypothetical protein
MRANSNRPKIRPTMLRHIAQVIVKLQYLVGYDENKVRTSQFD